MCCDARGKSDGQQSFPGWRGENVKKRGERMGVIDQEGPGCLFSPVWLPREKNEKKGTKVTWLS
jgi:hypothetical protein